MSWQLRYKANGFILESYDSKPEADAAYERLYDVYGDRLEVVEYRAGLTTENFGRVLIREDVEQ